MVSDEGRYANVDYSTSRERLSVLQGCPVAPWARLDASAAVHPVLFCPRFSSSTSEHLAEERASLSVASKI